ncbi:MAG: histidine phosphatase family protein [Rhodocyclaceae bacterium]|nr:histidine phosphatase family protein [Rhodocyclaceae bacterium]
MSAITPAAWPPATRFLFLRHGCTDYNQAGLRCGGDIDIPLNAEGRRQAAQAAQLIAASGWPLAWIVTSPLQRTQATAAAVAAALGDATVNVDPRLCERRLGAWNGQPAELTESALRRGETPPGGESRADFRTRVLAWLEDWQSRLAQPGLIVASKGISRVLSEELAGEDCRADNGQVLVFAYNRTGFSVNALNQG